MPASAALFLIALGCLATLLIGARFLKRGMREDGAVCIAVALLVLAVLGVTMATA